MAAVEELRASRHLIGALEAENRALSERVASEKRVAEVLGELNRTRAAESEALRSTVAAKNQAIAAKDSVIAAQDKLADQLKKKKPSPWRRLGDILIGAAVFAVLK